MKNKINRLDPLPTLGGKSQIISKLCRVIQSAHEEYEITGILDLFSGGNRLFRNLDMEVFHSLDFMIANELDLGVVNFFRCLQDAYTTDELIKQIILAADEIATKEDFDQANEERRNEQTDIIRSGALTYVIAKYSRAADRQNFIQKDASKGISLKSLSNLYFQHEVYSEVQLICGDYKTVIDKYKDCPKVLLYLDPPYITDNKMKGKAKKKTKVTAGYIDEFTVEDHERMVDYLLSTNNKVILSGYKNAVYERLEQNGFHCYLLGQVNVSSAANSTTRYEYIWTNFVVEPHLVDDEDNHRN